MEYSRHQTRTEQQLEILTEGEVIILAAIDDLNAAVAKVEADVQALIAANQAATPDLSGAISALDAADASAQAVLNPPAPAEPAPADAPAA